MARLQEAIKTLAEVFVEYADDDGKLSKEELKNMMEKEIDCPEAKAKLAEGRDQGLGSRMKRDLDFEHFLKIICGMATVGYNKAKK